MQKALQSFFGGINDWLLGIRSYFQFLNDRRLDTRFSVLPSARGLFLFFACVFATLIFALLILDPLYLKWYEYEHALRVKIFNPLTVLGDSQWALLIFGIALLVISFFRFDRYKGANYVVLHRLAMGMYFIFTSVALSGVIAVLFKNFIGKARPQYAMYREDIHIWTFIPFEDKYAFASFPSGHSTTAGVMVAIGLLMFPRWGWMLVLLGLWVALSRTAIGVHYPSDVIAGLMLGYFFTRFYARSFARKRLLFAFNNKGKLCLRGNNAL